MAKLWLNNTPRHAGQHAEIFGWIDNVRDHGKVIFLDVRDRSAILQCVVNQANAELFQRAKSLTLESVVRLSGAISKRPEKLINKNIPTGEIELQVQDIEILSLAKTPPIPLGSDGRDINEEMRLKYRYLDLRRRRLLHNLSVRNAVLQYMRIFLIGRDFIEIETPILTKSTPEGARDFVVPSRLYPGNFYALPQSPQQYKQLLMVAGIERYFQIARCFRDEDPRGDRQPEFTQLDLEMSFGSRDEILDLIEEMYTGIIEAIFPKKRISQKPFPRFSYKEVMQKYGTDKPDLRKDKNDENELAFAFVVDFPMFEWHAGEKRWDATHHPFTRPNVKDAAELKAMFAKDPGSIIAEQYDFVLNGVEIGGGSVRIHQPELLAAVFELLGHQREEIEQKFGHMLDAFSYGVPPHGGIAPGIDRFLMVVLNEPNIREVMAFPKTGDSRDPMMQSPSEISEDQLKELRLRIDSEKKKKK